MPLTSRAIRCVRLGGLLTLAVAGFARPAEAYIDPGAGGMLTQLLLGTVAAGAVLIRAYWHRLTRVFRRTRPDAKLPPHHE